MIKHSKKIEVQFYDTNDIVNIPTFPESIDVIILHKGDFRSNGRTVSRQNVLWLEKVYDEQAHVDDMLNDFLDNYMGNNLLKSLRNQLVPKQTFIRVHIPVISSKLCQDTNIPVCMLKRLAEMDLSLDFWFV